MVGRQPLTIFTVGHSSHTIEHFVGLLKRHGLEEVADVRSSPYSKYCPQFNRDMLEESLHAAGIAYLFLGDQLGARPAGYECYKDGRVDFHRLQGTARFREGLERLCGEASARRVAIMCAEKDPLDCHRMIVVCRALRGMGVEIQHVLADGRLEPNREAERRLVRLARVERTLFDSDKSDEGLVQKAYDAQAEAISYAAEVRGDVAVGGDVA
jgi:uncharacterized protein (DUF488 family)